MPRPEIIVIGGSAGAIEPLTQVLAGMPRDIPAAIALVVHTSPESAGALPQVLRRAVDVPVILAGFDQHVTKPVTLEELEAILARLN